MENRELIIKELRSYVDAYPSLNSVDAILPECLAFIDQEHIEYYDTDLNKYELDIKTQDDIYYAVGVFITIKIHGNEHGFIPADIMEDVNLDELSPESYLHIPFDDDRPLMTEIPDHL